MSPETEMCATGHWEDYISGFFYSGGSERPESRYMLRHAL